MAYAVEGNDLDPSEFNDGSWTLALDMQKKYRRRTGTVSSPINGETTLTSQSVPTPRRQARPPPTVRRRPMPRLSEDDYKVVLRPNGAINLTDVGPGIIVEAICIAASIDFRGTQRRPVSTPDRLRAEAYRKITQLQHERNALSIPVAAYVPAPDNSVKGVIYKAHSYEDDQAIYEEVSGRNPDLPVGEKPTCPSSCVVCGGGHQTGSRNCKYRFITKKQPGKPVAADNAKGQEIDKPAPDSIPSQQGTTTKNKTAATWESRSKENNGGESWSRSESFPPLRGRSESRDRSENNDNHDAQPGSLTRCRGANKITQRELSAHETS
ncbi:hypothetical protein HPB52_002805 [Rhipicephalus sanguineus]|uniref:Uncharacterized protein n=1 Tax=Rhipicephalus sanguineus TaxID=34632 RepID=A0A9D4PU29_RHISA|nr:hypothetical protein HPB52_002805 [Rhipicephalus sanguineus]